ncbi:hypothetical protein TWF192_009934 [Orbilia oligospora]|nr:hypothetical protein TWF192_009934 [Orbilia oligospora]
MSKTFVVVPSLSDSIGQTRSCSKGEREGGERDNGSALVQQEICTAEFTNGVPEEREWNRIVQFTGEVPIDNIHSTALPRIRYFILLLASSIRFYTGRVWCRRTRQGKKEG